MTRKLLGHRETRLATAKMYLEFEVSFAPTKHTSLFLPGLVASRLLKSKKRQGVSRLGKIEEMGSFEKKIDSRLCKC